MNKKTDTPIGYNLDSAIKDMNKAVNNNNSLIPMTDKEKELSAIDYKKLEKDQEIKAVEEALIEPFSRKHKTGVKLIDKRMRAILLKLAEKYFFYKAICAKAGIYERRLTEELSGNEAFASSFAYARHKFIAHHQQLLIQYAKDKREKDWRAEKYILTIADKEYSERKYLTEAVSNQEAKILMLIKAEKLTIASKQGKKMLEGVIDTPLQDETISLKPFKKPKAKKLNSKG